MLRHQLVAERQETKQNVLLTKVFPRIVAEYRDRNDDLLREVAIQKERCDALKEVFYESGESAAQIKGYLIHAWGGDMDLFPEFNSSDSSDSDEDEITKLSRSP